MKNVINNKRKGFTLLEAMMALAIFAAGALVILAHYVIQMKTAQAVREKETALLLIQNKVDDLQLHPDEIQDTGGSFSFAPEYSWELAFDQKITGETDLALDAGTLTVSWEHGSVSCLAPIVKESDEKTP